MVGKFDAKKLEQYLSMARLYLKQRIHNDTEKKKKDEMQLKRDIVANEDDVELKANVICREINRLKAMDIILKYTGVVEKSVDVIAREKSIPGAEQDMGGPFSLYTQICTLIYAAGRVRIKKKVKDKEIDALEMAKKQFANKYGNNFVKTAEENYRGCVNDDVVLGLSASPSATQVLQYLREITKTFENNWEPSEMLVQAADIESARGEGGGDDLPIAYAVDNDQVDEKQFVDPHALMFQELSARFETRARSRKRSLSE